MRCSRWALVGTTGEKHTDSISIYIHKCIGIHIYIHIAQAYTFACAHTQTHTHVIYIYTCTYTYVYTYRLYGTRTHTHTHTHVHICIYACTEPYIHTSALNCIALNTQKTQGSPKGQHDWYCKTYVNCPPQVIQAFSWQQVTILFLEVTSTF